MSIQPLSSSTLPTYSPTAGAKPATEAPSPKEVTPSTVRTNSRQNETQRINQAEVRDALREATQKANQAIAGLRSDLKFTVDEETGSDVVRFVDVKTKEIIRQIPAQEMLVIAKRLDELSGLLIKERV